MGKFLFYDIDGTLVGKSRVVTEKTKEAIQKARRNGHKAFLCTGRAPTSLVGDVMNIEFDGIICSAGGYIIINGEYIFENFINQYVLSEVMTLFINNNVHFNLETKHAIYETPRYTNFIANKMMSYAGNNPELVRQFQLKRDGEVRLPISNFNILTTGVTKLCFVTDDKEHFKKMIPFLDDFFNVVFFSKDEDDYYQGEIILKHCTKADGIIKVVNHFKGQMKDTISFGDSMNDYQMLEATHTSVVYEGASKELLDLADYCFKDPDEDGIAVVMEQLGLLK